MTELYVGLGRGLELWQSGQPFEAHEAWEAVWISAPEPERTLLKGLIQLAAAWVKAQQGNSVGREANLDKARKQIATAQTQRSAVLGFDLLELSRALEAPASGDSGWKAMLPSKAASSGVVYLHGFASSPGSYKALQVKEALSKRGIPIRVPDLNEDDFRNLTVTRALARTQRCLFDRTLLVGSSMGGYLASLLATTERRVRGLVLMAPAFELAERIEGRFTDEEMAAWRARGFHLVEHFGYGRELPLAYTYFEDARTHPSRPIPHQPAFIVTGRHDDVVPARLVEDVVTNWPQAELEVVDDDHALAASVDPVIRGILRIWSKSVTVPGQ